MRRVKKNFCLALLQAMNPGAIDIKISAFKITKRRRSD
jgi:hypothetical protein